MTQKWSSDDDGLIPYQTMKLQYKEDIYFFEVNTKYISSNILKISVISRVLRTREITDFFNK